MLSVPRFLFNHKLEKCFVHCSKRTQHTLTSTEFDSESNISKHTKASKEKHDLILTILNSTATKREARSYLSKYSLLEENDIYKNKQRIIDYEHSDIHSPLVANKRYSKYIGKFLGKNLDKKNEYTDLNDVTYSAAEKGLLKTESPVLMTTPNTPQRRVNDASSEIKLTQTIRACVLRIRRLDRWDDETVRSLSVVLRKAMSLGASPVIIIDGDIVQGCIAHTEKGIEDFVELKLENFISNLGDLLPSRIVQGCFDLHEDGKLEVVTPEMIGVPIFSGIIPILSPFVVKSGKLIKQCVEGFELTKATIDCLQSEDMKDLLSVEKVVFVDDVGGFPSVERSDGSHVLINLLQEYDVIKRELKYELNLSDNEKNKHLTNLKEMKQLLDSSPDMTGILTTPEMAAHEEEKQVGKETNPIIYNILTDRPTISSSLPVFLRRTPQLNTTVIKLGMPISVFLSNDSNNGLDLIEMEKNHIIDLSKLKYLIDDSFGRNLNMNHYLNRINGKVAGLIIAGNYDGGAIITWENTGDRKVAYLDKFAVVKKLQGIPGIADVVFKAMLKSFEDELLWRSRRNNPVNKWYFERSIANYSIEGTQWRFFFTGKNKLGLQNLEEYVKICESIEPSFDI